MNINSLYYIAEVREPFTCRVCGYIVKEAKSKTKVEGCPVYSTREQAERYISKACCRLCDDGETHYSV